MRMVFIWGVAAQGRVVCKLLESIGGHEVIGFIDKNPLLIGTIVLGRNVYSPEHIALLDSDVLVLIASRFFHEIRLTLLYSNHKNYCDAGKYIMFSKYARYFPLCMEHVWDSVRSNSSSHEDGREDVIIEAVFNAVGINAPKYIDIGAFHPILSSNTYLFYTKGSSGVAVDPLTTHKEAWAMTRPRDVFLNIALSDTSSENALFYNTGHTYMHSKTDADYFADLRGGESLPQYVRQDVFNNIAQKDVQLVDIDTDGLDMQVLLSINFELFPDILVICIEQTNEECFDYMGACGFDLFCANYLNSIFIRKSITQRVFADKLCHEIFSWHRIWRLLACVVPDYYLPL